MRFTLPNPKVWLVAAMASAAVVAIGPATLFHYLRGRLIPAEPAAPNEVVIWHAWGGADKERVERLFARYASTHPGIRVRTVFAPNMAGAAGGSQKFFTAVAAGKTPDVIFVDSSQVAEWANQGGLEPLDERVRASAVDPSDFFGPAWKSGNYGGHTWAISYCADPNFALAWNKDVFRRSGLDPERPPRTMAEMDAMSDRITTVSGGKLRGIGIIPWGQFGGSNSLITWGWAFGGDFYDEQTGHVTANNPKVVAALEWMLSYAKRYDVNRVQGFSAGFGTLDRNPFYTGEVGMTCFHVNQVADARVYAPKLDYGLAPLPNPEGGEPGSSWLGGWCMGIPRGARRPDRAWDVIHWACATPEGTLAVGETTNLFPGYRKSPWFDKIGVDSQYGIFVRILAETRHQRPVMPAVDFYMGALDRAVQYTLYGQKTPKEALDGAVAETERELSFKMAGVGEP